MRKVTVLTYAKYNNGNYIQPFQLVASYEGKFHQWGLNFQELTGGVGQYTVAIVEKPDGKVEMVETALIVFKHNDQ